MKKGLKILNNLQKVNSIIDRREIRDLIFEGIANLEKGMKGLEKDLKTPVGNIDIIARDMIGRLVIIEIGTEYEDALLFNAIDHFDWAINHIENLVKYYEAEGLDPTLAPRIVLLAPSYSEKFIRRASYLSPTFVDIYEYQVRETAGIRKVYFRAFSFLHEKKWVVDLHAKSIDDHLKYIEDKELRNLAKNFIAELQALRNDLILDTSRGYILLTTKDSRQRIAIYTLKNSFWINFNNIRWEGVLIKKGTDIQRIKDKIVSKLLQ